MSYCRYCRQYQHEKRNGIIFPTRPAMVEISVLGVVLAVVAVRTSHNCRVSADVQLNWGPCNDEQVEQAQRAPAKPRPILGRRLGRGIYGR